MHELNVSLAIAGGLILTIATFSGVIKGRLYLSAPLLATAAGVVVGPLGFAWLDPHQWGEEKTLLHELARLTLAISLMGVALRIPAGYLWSEWRPLATLLTLVMALMWLSTTLILSVVLGLPVLVALLTGAVLTPTDPVVASSIVTGKMAEESLPDRIRHVISAESGSNDGLAYPFVLLPLLLLTEAQPGALQSFGVEVLLHKTLGAILFGSVVGYCAGKLLEWAEARASIDSAPYLAYTIALSLFASGAAALAGANSILAVFVTGVAFDLSVSDREQHQEESVQEMVSKFFTLPIFLFFGMILPVSDWWQLGWKAPLAAALVMLLRRLPALLLVRPLMGRLKSWTDTLFVGWFGPIGVAAIFYATLSVNYTGKHEVWAIASLVIAASLLVHGVTATPGAKRYARAEGRQ